MVNECQSCGAEGLEVFYSVKQVPVHSCLMVKSREDALAFPRGDLEIAFCPSCGFVQNSAFDPSVHNYSPDYEETQGFSPQTLHGPGGAHTQGVAPQRPQGSGSSGSPSHSGSLKCS